MDMKKTRKRRSRTYSDEFKQMRVKEYDRGEFTVSELSRLYEIRPQVIYKWIEKYSLLSKQNAIVIEMKGSSTNKLKEYENKIKELERLLGKKEAMLDFQEQIIELASEHYETDIKKNFSTKR